jgi:hypothetical protein
MSLAETPASAATTALCNLGTANFKSYFIFSKKP